MSFEIFPPKNHDGDISSIYQTIDELAKLKPDFISVTYGAGGSTTENTVEIASKIKNEYSIEAVAHLSCIDATPEQLIRVLDSLKANNIENVLALRGDYPRGYDPMKAPHYYKYASELNDFISKNYPDTFCLSGACSVKSITSPSSLHKFSLITTIIIVWLEKLELEESMFRLLQE